MAFKDKVLNWVQSYVVEGRPPNSVGPKEFSNGGWTGVKPWRELYPDKGIFVGENGAVWAFFRTPDNVNTTWLSNPGEGMKRQLFFNEVIDALGDRLNNAIVKQHGDLRRKFRLSIIRSDFDHLHWDEKDDTPGTVSYRRRISDKINRPEWNGYFGVELMKSTMSESATSLSELAEWGVRGHRNITTLYMSDYNDVKQILEDEGFSAITDMDLDSEDYLNLTAWHGVKSDSYNVQRHLESTRFLEPTDGYSVITPRWGEISFFAAVPSEERDSFGEDPRSESARWARPLYNPGNNVVGVWIEGEIRSGKVMKNILRSKRYGRERAAADVPEGDYAEQEKVWTDLELIHNMDAVADGRDFIDNCEILVAVQCFTEETNSLRRHLRDYGMDARMPVSRQAKCLARTMPCYPDGISKIYRNNMVRGAFSTQMFPGALSMSGILQRTRPACNNGILLGLTNLDHEFREVFTAVDAANTQSAPPVMLITGRQGSGKTMQGLQMMIQVAYDERPVVFLNPKPDSSFGHLFDYIGGTTITMTEAFLEESPGMLDPFAFYTDRSEVFAHLNEALEMSLDTNADRGADARSASTALSADLKNRVIDKRNRCSADVIFGNAAGRDNYQNALDELNREKYGRWQEKKRVLQMNGSDVEQEPFVPVKDGELSDEDQEWVKIFLSDVNGTPPIPQLSVRKFVRDKIQTSAIWKALIGDTGEGSELQRMLSEGKPVLIEWDGSLNLPKDSNAMTNGMNNLSVSQVDSVISITLAFHYAEEIITKIGRGGILAVDEAWTLKGSESVRGMINGVVREGRERNIMLLMMTQKIADFLDDEADDMSSGVARYLFMSVPENDKKERDLFFRYSGWEDDESGSNWQYMVNAGIKSRDGSSTKKAVAEGFYVDTIYGFSGALLCGPWPDLELNMARTDPEGKKWQRAYKKDKSMAMALVEDSQYHVTAENFLNMVVSNDDEEESLV